MKLRLFCLMLIAFFSWSASASTWELSCRFDGKTERSDKSSYPYLVHYSKEYLVEVQGMGPEGQISYSILHTPTGAYFDSTVWSRFAATGRMKSFQGTRIDFECRLDPVPPAQ